MKKILIAILLAATLAHAGTNDVTTNYFAGYVYIPNTYTNAGTTGLTVSNAYICFPVSTLTGMTTNQQADVRAVMYAVNQEFYESYTNKSAATRSASVPAYSAYYQTSGTNLLEIIIHTIRTTRTLSAGTLP